MIQLSKFPFKTMKSTPNGSDNISTGLLLQSGMIRQVMAWVYTYTTLWLQVLKNIENIVREEMNNYDCFETLMPALSPRDAWEKTWRWDSIDVFFHIPVTNDKEYWLNSTHEEIITPLLWEFIQSYKDLPVCAYQIQNKFRNEKRAKSWLLRGREFIMKDAYSFHSSDEEFKEYYEGMKKVYLKIFERLWLGNDIYIAQADGGTFTDKYSHEFQVKLEIGEDLIFLDPLSKECFNKEVTPSMISTPNKSDAILLEREDIYAPWVIGVEALTKTLGVPAHKATKTMMFETNDGKFIVASVRGDYDINTLKLQKIIGCKWLSLAQEEKIKQMTGAEVGYAGIYNLPASWIELYLDDSLVWLTNFETGTNKTWYHSKNVNFWKDILEPKKFYDFKEAKIWDKNPNTWEIYEVFKWCEVGNIFPLETKFSLALGVKYLDENNQEKIPLMGCYGIGISRLMGVIAEYYMDKNGIAWPENIAPAYYYIIVLWEENLQRASSYAKNLEKEGKKVIFDDRMGKKIWFGQKMGDAELLGIKNIVIFSDKTKDTEKWYETKIRGEK